MPNHYISVISSQRPKTVGVDYSRIEYMRNIKSMRVLDVWLFWHIFFHPGLYNKTYIQSVCSELHQMLYMASEKF